MKTIRVLCAQEHADTIRGIARHFEVADSWQFELHAVDPWRPTDEPDEAPEPRRVITDFVVKPEALQAVLDALQGALASDPTARVIVTPTEVVLPRAEKPPPEEKPHEAAAPAEEPTLRRRWRTGPSRDVLYEAVGGSGRINAQFVMLVVLAAVVASIGLATDNVPAVIGAMVIAPLLGPNLAMALGTSLGDYPLVSQAARANALGLAIAIVVGIAAGQIFESQIGQSQMLDNVDVGGDTIALGAASGAAAVLSVTAGLPAVLVGVMVAVALLPPAVSLGIGIGAGDRDLAVAAALLLAANVASVNLAGNLVFLAQGVVPRRGRERRQARAAVLTYTAAWAVSLLVIGLAISLR